MLHVVEVVRRDLRYAARLLRRGPGFTLAAVLSLALAIGGTTAMFQLLEAVRLRSLPVTKPGELVEITLLGGRRGVGIADMPIASLTYPMWEGIRDHQHALSAIFAWAPFDLPGGADGETRRTAGVWVSGDFFSTLRLTPHRGRLLEREDDRRGCAPDAVVISYPYWQRWFAARDTAIGQPLAIGGHTFHIVGVTPPPFYGIEVGRQFDVAIPLCTARFWGNPRERRNYFWLTVMGRLSSGWSVSSTAGHVAALSPALMEAAMPPDLTSSAASIWRGYTLTASSGGHGVSVWRQEYENPLWLLLGITGLVLLIACANVANLMLARAAPRTREFAVRRSLGATPLGLVLQSLAESLLLAAAGTLLGIACAGILSRGLVLLLTTEDNRLHLDLGLDWMMLTFASAVGVFTCLACGLAPALRSARTQPADVMKASGRMATGPDRFFVQRALAIAQIAISMVLMLGAWLFVGSFRNLLTLDTGFRQDGLMFAFADASEPGASPERLLARQEALLDRIRALPGVESAAGASQAPLAGMSWTREVEIPSSGMRGESWSTWVSPGYFRTMGMSMRMGRDFDVTDTRASRRVIVVNETFVRRYLTGSTPIGARVRTAESGASPVFQEVIGVVQDAKYADLREQIPPVAFSLMAQEAKVAPWMAMMIRVAGASSGIASTVRGVLVDERVPTPGVVIMREQVHERLLRERLMAWLAGAFGVMAGLLAVIGLYGLIAYLAERRSHEFAVRVALGAGRWNILRLTLGRACGVLAIGLPAGALAGAVLGRTASSVLFGVRPNDPATMTLVALLLAFVALAAGCVPAARAMRVAPAQALRAE